LIDDRCCGLRAARCWHPSDLGALGYAWLASSSIRKAINRMERYSTTVGDRASIVCTNTQDGLKVVLHQKPREADVRELVADFVMSIIMDMSRFNAGSSLMPVEVTLRRDQPECAMRYIDFYGCEAIFEAGEDSFTFAAEDADRPLPTSNKQLAGLHDQVLAQQLASLNRNNIAARCEAFILENLTSGDISAEQIAQGLHMTPRTLARRLEDQGSSVTSIVDEVRRELASRYLADPMKSVTEVAFLLGFAHPSSLSRASTRWFGVSPIEYRSAQG
jgi:AraC-like DNA-binding protein